MNEDFLLSSSYPFSSNVNLKYVRTESSEENLSLDLILFASHELMSYIKLCEQTHHFDSQDIVTVPISPTSIRVLECFNCQHTATGIVFTYMQTNNLGLGLTSCLCRGFRPDQNCFDNRYCVIFSYSSNLLRGRK